MDLGSFSGVNFGDTNWIDSGYDAPALHRQMLHQTQNHATFGWQCGGGQAKNVYGTIKEALLAKKSSEFEAGAFHCAAAPGAVRMRRQPDQQSGHHLLESAAWS